MDGIIKLATSLSPPAAIAFTAVSAGLFWITGFGIIEVATPTRRRMYRPRRWPPSSSTPTALNAATAARNRHSNATEHETKAIEGLTKSVDHMAIEFDREREELRTQREIARRN